MMDANVSDFTKSCTGFIETSLFCHQFKVALVSP